MKRFLSILTSNISEFHSTGLLLIALGGILWFVSPVFASPVVADSDSDGSSYHSSSSWIFDSGPYSNNPKTGARVDQYAKPELSYHNPNAWFESPGPSILDGSEQRYQYNIMYPMGGYDKYIVDKYIQKTSE